MILKDFKITADPYYIVIDLFCGAGGTTTGFEEAYYVGPDGKLHKSAIVAACVNHDHKAIKSHWLNHPLVEHFNEDITKLYGECRHGIFFKSPEMLRLMRMVDLYRAFYPNAKIILWASLECTNFSKAKGGLARDADSRTLAEHLQFYIDALQPDFIQIENVVEFMAWGPLDENGKPISKKNGRDWIKWKQHLCSYGYKDDWKEINSADLGAFTSRNRLFGIFAKDCDNIAWPEPTHTKKPGHGGMFANQQKWKAVKEVLDFQDEGESIFTRKKPLSDKTYERIFAGLLKYVAKGDKAFISKYFSGRPAGKVNSIESPSSTITTFAGNTLVQPISILKYNSTDKTGKHYPPSVDEPSPVLTTQNRLGIVQGEFLLHYYSKSGFHSSVDEPGRTLRTKDTSAIVKPEHFIEKSYGGYRNNQSIDAPAGTIMPNDKHRLIEAEPFLDINQKVRVDCNCGKSRISSEAKYEREPCPNCGGFSGYVSFIMPTSYDNKPKSIDEPAPTIQASRRHHYLVNPSWGGNPGSIDQPSPVIIARQDKAPLYLVQAEHGPVQIAVYEEDTEIVIKIKEFMAHYHLVDIKMRMLRVHELLKIQGFPAGYKLEGNQTDQKKFIGNSVVPLVVKAWTEALVNNQKLAA